MYDHNDQAPENLIDNFEIVQNPWKYDLHFLRSLSKTSPNEILYYRTAYLQNEVTRDKLLKRFFEDEYIGISSLEDIIKTKLTIAQLKVSLKDKNLKVTGIKDDLVLRYKDSLSEEEVKSFEQQAYYVLTPKGREVLEKDSERTESHIKAIMIFCEQLIITKEFEKAFNIITILFDWSPYSSGMGSMNWEREFRIFMETITGQYLGSELMIDEDVKRLIYAAVAIHQLVYQRGFFNEVISVRLLEIWPEFHCELIRRFLVRSPFGIFQGYDSKNRNDIANIFGHMVFIHTANRINLLDIHSLASDSYFKDRYIGVTIMGSQSCTLCAGKDTCVRWQEIKCLPLVPRYPGCTCRYFPWRKDD